MHRGTEGLNFALGVVEDSELIFMSVEVDCALGVAEDSKLILILERVSSIFTSQKIKVTNHKDYISLFFQTRNSKIKN